MSTWKRLMVTIQVMIACTIVGIIYYRVFTPELVPLVKNDFDGPFTEAVLTTKNIVPTLLLVIVFAFLVWTAIGDLQQERKRDRTRRRR